MSVEILRPQETPPIPIEVSNAVYDALCDGRQYFGSAGAALTHCGFKGGVKQTNMNSQAVAAGLRGERGTSDWMREWMRDKPDLILVDSVRVIDPAIVGDVDEEGNADGPDTDHVLLLGDQIVIVDTKRWRAGRYAIAKGNQIVRNGKPFPGSMPKAVAARMFWERAIPLANRVQSVVLLSGEGKASSRYSGNNAITVIRDYAWYHAGYVLLDPDRKVSWFDEWYMKNRAGRIDSTMVTQVAVNAIAPYDARSNVLTNIGGRLW